MWLVRIVSVLITFFSFVSSCADFIFVLDGSASVQQQFKHMIATAKSIASELTVDSEGHRASILEYSSIAKLQKWPRYYFEHISSQPALQEAFDQLPHVQGGTDTGSALGVVLDEFVLRRRNGVPLIIFTISDGYHRDEETVRKNVAKLASLKNVHLFAATSSSFYSIRGMVSLTNGNQSRVAIGDDVVQHSKDLLKPFTKCRVRRSDLRRKPESKTTPIIKTTTTTTRTTARTTTSTTTTLRTTTTKPYTGKPGCQMDIVLLMDFSGGAVDKRDAYVELASSLIKNLHLGPFDVQVAMVRYSGPGRTNTVFHLKKYTNASDAIAEMTKAQHMGGTTRTGEAIKFAVNEFDEKYGGRNNAKKIIILFTDGYSQVELQSSLGNFVDVDGKNLRRPIKEDPTDAADSARRSGVEMNVVAIEDELVPPDTDQLIAIASQSGVYMASAFEKLRLKISDRLRQCN